MLLMAVNKRKLEQSENLLQTLCLPQNYLDLMHTDGQMASPKYNHKKRW